MIIPRLPPSANPIDVTITVNEKLRPYFTLWFDKTKLNGESPQDFVLRKLKDQFMDDYIKASSGDLYTDRQNEIMSDIPVFEGELD